HPAAWQPGFGVGNDRLDGVILARCKEPVAQPADRIAQLVIGLAHRRKALWGAFRGVRAHQLQVTTANSLVGTVNGQAEHGIGISHRALTESSQRLRRLRRLPRADGGGSSNSSSASKSNQSSSSSSSDRPKRSASAPSSSGGGSSSMLR